MYFRNARGSGLTCVGSIKSHVALVHVSLRSETNSYLTTTDINRLRDSITRRELVGEDIFGIGWVANVHQV